MFQPLEPQRNPKHSISLFFSVNRQMILFGKRSELKRSSGLCHKWHRFQVFLAASFLFGWIVSKCCRDAKSLVQIFLKGI